MIVLIKKTEALAAFVCAVVIVVAGSSQASTLINVDWIKNTPVYSGGAALGSVGDFWNSTDPEVTTDITNALDASSVATTVDITWQNLSSSNNPVINYSTSGPGGTDLNPLMQDYGFTSPGTIATINIDQLPANTDYTLYLFGLPDGGSQDVTFEVTGANEPAATLSGSVNNDNNGIASGVDYAVFTGNTGAGGSIVYTQTGSSFSGSAGLQLEYTAIPEPSAVVLSTLGLVGLAVLSRRRK